MAAAMGLRGRVRAARLLALVAGVAWIAGTAGAPQARADGNGVQGAQGTSPGAAFVSSSGGQRPTSPPGAFSESPYGFEVSSAQVEDLKHQWPDGFATGGAEVDVDGNDGSSGGGASLFPGPGPNGWIPYDAALAVGPNDVLACVNASWSAYTRTGTLEASATFDSFYGTAAGTAFDPKCFYDAAGQHFVMLATSTGNGLANMYVAVSKTSSVSDGWYTYTMDWRVDGTTTTSNWGDFPGLGYDDNAVYVSANQYTTGGSFQYAKVRVLKKSELYYGSPLTYTDFVGMTNADGTKAFTLKPARCISSSGSGHLLNTRPGGGSSVTLWRIDAPTTSPTLTRVATVSVGTYGVPPNAKQAGGRNLVATGDCRTQEIVWRDGLLHTAFTETYGVKRGKSQSALRYLRIDTGTAQKAADTTYRGASGVYFYYPAVTVDASGNVVMCFNRSSSNEYISMATATIPAGSTTFGTSTTLVAGTTYMSQRRWGDYNAIQIEDGNGAWVMTGTGRSYIWATDILNVSVP